MDDFVCRLVFVFPLIVCRGRFHIMTIELTDEVSMQAPAWPLHLQCCGSMLLSAMESFLCYQRGTCYLGNRLGCLEISMALIRLTAQLNITQSQYQKLCLEIRESQLCFTHDFRIKFAFMYLKFFPLHQFSITALKWQEIPAASSCIGFPSPSSLVPVPHHAPFPY